MFDVGDSSLVTKEKGLVCVGKADCSDVTYIMNFVKKTNVYKGYTIRKL